MTETVLPPAHKYADGSLKTILVNGEEETYRVTSGQWVRVGDTITRSELETAVAAIPIGGRASFFLSANASEVATYGTFSASTFGLAGTEISAVCAEPDTEYLIKAFITNGNFSSVRVPSGDWAFHVNAKVSATGGITKLVFRVYKRTSLGVETELFSTESAEINSTDMTMVETDYVLAADIDVDVSDDLVVKVYAKSDSVADRTVTIAVDGTAHASHVETTMGVEFDPAAPQTITGLWSFDVSGGKSLIISDDPTLIAATRSVLFLDHHSSYPTTMQFSYDITNAVGANSVSYGTVLNDDGKVIHNSGSLVNANGFTGDTTTLEAGGTSYRGVTVDVFHVAGLLRNTVYKSGTLASPPAGMAIGEVWADTTTSATHPIYRISTVTT